MIVVAEPPDLLLITQPDHARFAAELLALWTRDGLPDLGRRDDLLFAAREHDNGWREADAAPRVDPATGRPHDFLSLPSADRLELWRRGAGRFRTRRPWATLLILRHALALHRDRQGDAGWSDLLAELAAREEELRGETGAATAELDFAYRYLALADRLSLAVCNRWRDPTGGEGYHARLGEEGLVISPFPLAGATTFRIPCRRVFARRFRGDADLGAALAAARWTEIGVRVVPPPQAP